MKLLVAMILFVSFCSIAGIEVRDHFFAENPTGSFYWGMFCMGF